jgi:hypothetical protein
MKLGSFAMCSFTKRSAAVVAMALLAFWPAISAGSVIVSLNNPGSTTLHEVWVTPGGTFDVDLNLASDQVVGWVSFSAEASESNVFDITQLTDNAPWSSQGTELSILGSLDPTAGPCATRYATIPYRFGPGSTTLCTIQVTVDSGSTLGTYGIDTADVWWTTSPAIPERDPGAPGPTFIAHVVPEPSSVAMFVFIGFFLSRRWS